MHDNIERYLQRSIAYPLLEHGIQLLGYIGNANIVVKRYVVPEPER